MCRVGALRGKRAAAKEAKRKAELGGEAAKAAKVARSVGSAAGALAAAHAASKAPAPPVARNAFEMLLAQRAELAKELAAVKAENVALRAALSAAGLALPREVPRQEASSVGGASIGGRAQSPPSSAGSPPVVVDASTLHPNEIVDSDFDALLEEDTMGLMEGDLRALLDAPLQLVAVAGGGDAGGPGSSGSMNAGPLTEGADDIGGGAAAAALSSSRSLRAQGAELRDKMADAMPPPPPRGVVWCRRWLAAMLSAAALVLVALALAGSTVAIVDEQSATEDQAEEVLAKVDEMIQRAEVRQNGTAAGGGGPVAPVDAMHSGHQGELATAILELAADGVVTTSQLIDPNTLEFARLGALQYDNATVLYVLHTAAVADGLLAPNSTVDFNSEADIELLEDIVIEAALSLAASMEPAQTDKVGGSPKLLKKKEKEKKKKKKKKKGKKTIKPKAGVDKKKERRLAETLEHGGDVANSTFHGTGERNQTLADDAAAPPSAEERGTRQQTRRRWRRQVPLRPQWRAAGGGGRRGGGAGGGGRRGCRGRGRPGRGGGHGDGRGGGEEKEEQGQDGEKGGAFRRRAGPAARAARAGHRRLGGLGWAYLVVAHGVATCLAARRRTVVVPVPVEPLYAHPAKGAA